MRRPAWAQGRRGAVAGATAVVVCLGGLVAATTGGDGHAGYVATGSAGAYTGPSRNVAPTDGVRLVPLDRADAGKGPDGTASPTRNPAPPDGPDTSGTPDARAESGGTTHSPGAGGTSAPGGSGTRQPGSHPPSTPPGRDHPGTGSPKPTTPGAPAALSVGTPDRTPGDHRWCEDVTVAFRNTGGTPVRSGTVTFGTHIIGALGIDWATIETAEDLPVPIAPGRTRKKTWTVCVDSWRVPLGMHIETRDVSVDWK
ncbi:hypothetical protein ACWCP6_09210 [Streptomyces sp. NPDC002004]